MDDLDSAFGKLTNTSNTLQAAISQIDSLIKNTEGLQSKLQAGQQYTAEDAIQYKESITKGLDTLYTNVPKNNHTLKGMYGAVNGYDKALKTTFRDSSNIPEVHSCLENTPDLIDRTLALHFARGGDYDLLNHMTEEMEEPAPFRVKNPLPYLSGDDSDPSFKSLSRESLNNTRTVGPGRQSCPEDPQLRESFSTLYKILHSVRTIRDLGPAIEWAQSRRDTLDNSASRIEFELCMLQYITILRQGGPDAIQRAWKFASKTLSQAHLWRQDSRRIQQLVCALAFPENLTVSPYNRIFDLSDAWDKIVSLISREFCIHMNIPSRSPLHTAVNAGVSGIPILIKLQQAMKTTKAGWSASKELAVEVPLPPSYIFHPIFVCPVSKEQATTDNPPMMLPCGHVISKTSVANLKEMSPNFKCPYCPRTTTDHTLVKKVYLR